MKKSFKEFTSYAKEKANSFSEETNHSNIGLGLIFRFRRLIYNIVDNKDSTISKIYNILIVLIAFFSVIPLFLTDQNIENASGWLKWIIENNGIWTLIFLSDYLVRWVVADFSLSKGWKSFLWYPITIWAIADMLGIIPFIFDLEFLRILTTFRLFRIVRIFPRLSEGFKAILYSAKSRMRILIVVVITLIFFVIFGGLVMFLIEQNESDLINNYWDAVWMVFITITTIGYGDIYPATEAGRIFTVFFSMVGIGMISVVTALLAAGFSDISLEEAEDDKQIQFTKYNYVSWVNQELNSDSIYKTIKDEQLIDFNEVKSPLDETGIDIPDETVNELNNANLSRNKEIKSKLLVDDKTKNFNYILIFELEDNDILKVKRRVLKQEDKRNENN